MNPESGIYQFRNIINHKIYIGSSINMFKRRESHISQLRENKHHSVRFQNAFNKYGELNFEFEPLVYISQLKEESRIEFGKRLTKVHEQIYLNTFLFAQEFIMSKGIDKRFYELSYNVSPTAGSSLGVKRSREPWNKGLTTITDNRLLESGRKGKITRSGSKSKRDFCSICKESYSLNILKSHHNENCHKRKKYIDSLRVKKVLKKQTKYKCKYCHINCTKTNLQRWHNDNCKSK